MKTTSPETKLDTQVLRDKRRALLLDELQEYYRIETTNQRRLNPTYLGEYEHLTLAHVVRYYHTETEQQRSLMVSQRYDWLKRHTPQGKNKLQIGKILDFIKQDKGDLYLTISSDDGTKVTYLNPHGKRTKTTLNRFIRRQIKVKAVDFKDSELDKLCCAVMAPFIDVSKYCKIVTGSDIVDAYSEAFGQFSCMSENDGEYTQVYAENPDKVAMLKFEHNDRQARALLWTCDDGVRVLDRIYPDSGNHVQAIRNWCDTQGIVYRTAEGYGGTDFSDGSGHSVTLKAPSNDLYPYMDTFKYSKERPTKSYTVNNSSGGYTLESTCGGFSDGDTGDQVDWHCTECEEGQHEDNDCTYVNDGDNMLCSYCADRFVSACGRCNEASYNRDMVEQDGRNYCETCHLEKFTTCEDCADVVEIDNTTTVDGGGKVVCEECLEDSYSTCEECDEIKPNESGATVDEKFYCEDCPQEEVVA